MDEYWPPDKKKKKQKTSVAENVVTDVVQLTMSPSPSDTDDGKVIPPAKETEHVLSDSQETREDCPAENGIPTLTLDQQSLLDGTEADSPSSRPAERDPRIGKWAGRLRRNPKRKTKPILYVDYLLVIRYVIA